MSIEDIEKMRKDLTKKAKISIIVSLVIILIFLIFIKDKTEYWWFIIFAILILYIPIFYNIFISVMRQKIQILEKEITKYVLSTAAQKVFANVEIDVEKGLSKELIKSTKSITVGPYYSSKNGIKGDYNSCHIELSDVSVEEPFRMEDDTYIPSFFGQWIVFDYDGNSNSNIQVIKNKLINGITSVSEKDFYKIELNDMDFKKRFRVISNDNISSYSVLTPQMLEKITKIETLLQDPIILVFFENKLHIGIYNSKVLLSVNLFPKVDYNKLIDICFNEFKQITDIIDLLELK